MVGQTRLGAALFAFVSVAGSALAQSGVQENRTIQDNSFLVEEAYNQEPAVVQHISTFSRMWNSKDWSYSFTQEWPFPDHWRHQLSFTLIAAHSGGFPGSGGGLGDVVLNYRYQVSGNGESRLAFAPRFSMLMPTGNVSLGRGFGATGIQMNLPLSIVLSRRFVTHWNVGGTFVSNAQSAYHYRAASLGYTWAQSVVFLATPRFNLLLESSDSRLQAVVMPGVTQWTRLTYLSPGVRWAHNFRNGLQIVPGIAMPIGIGASAGERGVFLYLSFEHPFVPR